MVRERQLRVFHIVVTAQFIVSASLVIFWSLWRTSLSWWQIFSLSTQGIVVVILGALIYGFAVFCGSLGGRHEGEHPLTGSIHYRVFYLLVPLLAGFAGGIDYLVTEGPLEGLRGWALGTVIAAYAVWLFIDPLVGIAELALPENRLARRMRIAADRQRHELERRQQADLLVGLRAQRSARLAALQPLIEGNAERLARMLVEGGDDPRRGRDEGALIGLSVWQEAGADTMRELYWATARRCADLGRGDVVQRLDYWWDGIGQWRQGDGPGLAS